MKKSAECRLKAILHTLCLLSLSIESGYLTTMLTSLRGMTMTFTASLPAIAAITFSSDKAALRKSSSLASGLAKMRLRSLPLTCTATSISSSRASSALNSGQRGLSQALRVTEALPQLFRDVRRERRQHRYQRLERFARHLNV